MKKKFLSWALPHECETIWTATGNFLSEIFRNRFSIALWTHLSNLLSILIQNEFTMGKLHSESICWRFKWILGQLLRLSSLLRQCIHRVHGLLKWMKWRFSKKRRKKRRNGKSWVNSHLTMLTEVPQFKFVRFCVVVFQLKYWKTPGRTALHHDCWIFNFITSHGEHLKPRALKVSKSLWHFKTQEFSLRMMPIEI